MHSEEDCSFPVTQLLQQPGISSPGETKEDLELNAGALPERSPMQPESTAGKSKKVILKWGYYSKGINNNKGILQPCM